MHIIPNQGVCDPHIHIFEDKAYLFSSHDAGPGMPIYTMYDWQIFSSDDLFNWKLEYVLKPEDTYIGLSSECYATDAAERNGKYYFYFSEQQRNTGVAVSTNGPAGPYKDALGKPLLPQGLVDTACYDPTVFIDDDENKTPYIIFGYTVCEKSYYIAKLNDDMISLAEDPKPIIIENGWKNDASWITKRNGIYYLNSHGSCYATSSNIYGPYQYRGTFCNDAYVDHGTFFNWHNQTFFTYGVPNNWGEEKVDPYYRTTKILYAHYKDNGDIAIDEFIQDVGVGQYDANWDKINSEWYFAASDGLYKRENSDGFEMRGFMNNSYLFYPKIKNIKGNATIQFYLMSKCKTNLSIEIRKDSFDGELLGTCEIAPSDENIKYQNVNCKLNNAAGQHDIYLVFKNKTSEDCLHFDWFNFI